MAPLAGGSFGAVSVIWEGRGVSRRPRANVFQSPSPLLAAAVIARASGGILRGAGAWRPSAARAASASLETRFSPAAVFDLCRTLKFLGALGGAPYSRPGADDEVTLTEERVTLLNLRNSFYAVFGTFYDIEYYPLARVFGGDPRMHRLASRAADFVRVYITSRPESAS